MARVFLSHTSADLCAERVRGADIYLGILGRRYGSLLPGGAVSYTEHEFDVATARGMPRLVFLLEEEVAPPEPAQRAFRERALTAGLTARFFADPHQLGALVERSLRDLAYAFRLAGRLDRATAGYREVIARQERILGPAHTDTLTSRNTLAYSLRLAGRLTEAIDLLEQVARARRRILGPDHLNTLVTQDNLAGTYRVAGCTTRYGSTKRSSPSGSWSWAIGTANPQGQRRPRPRLCRSDAGGRGLSPVPQDHRRRSRHHR